MAPINVVLHARLNPFQAQALAQFLKRLCWEDVERRTVDKDECHEVFEATRSLQDALAREGFNPR